MLAVGLRVRAKVVGRFDEVRRGLQENQRRHRGCESSWPRIPRILHCQCKCTSASTRGRCPRGPENFLFWARSWRCPVVWGALNTAFPHDFLFFDVLAGELEHESPVGLDAFYQPRRRVVHGVLPRHVGVRAAASVSKYHLIASL